MKNLKKVLALGLALVMILGMFTIASAAETEIKTADKFPDWNDVENKDAVSLMVDLGVINGTDKGTYAPAESINRASWAKMVYFVLTGETDAKLYETDYPALKDIDNNWAQGYIEYLYSIECVAGDTDGNYKPDAEIDVVSAAKTMLTGLGYNSKIEGYESDKNWATNIMSKAKSIGLLKGITLKQNDPITRDAAAQMVYNSLDAQTVKAKYTTNFMTGERVPNGEYEMGATQAYKAFGIVKVEATVTGVDKDGNAILANAKVANTTTDIAVTGKTVPATAANVGTKVSFYVKAEADFNEKGQITAAKVGDVVSSRLAGDASSVLKTINDGVDFTDENVWNSKEKAYVGFDKNDSVNFYVDGEDKTTEAQKVASGNKAELVDADNDGKVDIVRVTTYTVYTVKEDPSTKTKDDKTTVTVKLAGSAEKTIQADSSIVNGYAGLAADDVVLYSETKAKDGDKTVTVAYTLEKLEKAVTGKVASYKGSTLKVSGKDYDVSEVEYGVTAALEDIQKGENEYDFYLGKDGKICYAAVVGEEASKDLVLVMDVVAETTGSGFNKSDVISAKVLFVDGKNETVTLSSVKYDGQTEKAEGADIIGNTTGKFQEGEVVANIGLGFFTYKMNKDGNYDLTADAANKVDVTANSVELTGTNAIDGTVTANNSTVYIVAVGETAIHKDTTYTVYTGYKNAPKIEANKATAAVAYGEEGKAAKYVFIATPELKGAESKEMFFVPDVTDIYTDNENECKVLVAYNDKGEKIDLKVDSETNLADAKAGFYKVNSVSDKNVYTLDVAGVIGLDTAKTVTLDGGVLTIDSKFVDFDDDTEMKTITLDEDGAVTSYTTGKVEGSIADNDTNVYTALLGDGTTATDEVADVVYVIVAPAPAEAE